MFESRYSKVLTVILVIESINSNISNCNNSNFRFTWILSL